MNHLPEKCASRAGEDVPLRRDLRCGLQTEAGALCASVSTGADADAGASALATLTIQSSSSSTGRVRSIT
ncbi:hypothetical protein QP150_18790 [Sphingomonas sp. 22L2VL55-3]